MNTFFEELYAHDCWIPRRDAIKIVQAGNFFMKAYLYMAHQQYLQKKIGYALLPKLHFFHEIIHEMERQIDLNASWVYSPLVESCSMDEDFVGRLAIVTRHVNPRLMCLRTLQRYAVAIKLLWS